MSPDEQIISRLDRFEDKLDKLADAVLTIARVEERQAQHSRTLERVWNEVNAVREDVKGIKTRLSVVENKQSESSGKMSVWERIAWIVVAAIVGGASYFGR